MKVVEICRLITMDFWLANCTVSSQWISVHSSALLQIAHQLMQQPSKFSPNVVKTQKEEERRKMPCSCQRVRGHTDQTGAQCQKSTQQVQL